MTFKILVIKRNRIFQDDITIMKVEEYAVKYIPEQEMFIINVKTNRHFRNIYIPKKEFRELVYRERLE